VTDPYSSYQPPAPRRLVRSRNNRYIGGVCGGVADYLNMDPTLVRVLTVVVSVFTGVPIILYLIALFLLPEEETGGPRGYPPVNGPQSQSQWTYGSYPQSADNPMPQQPTYAPSPRPEAGRPQQHGVPEDRAVWGAAGAPWEQPTPPPGAGDPGTANPGTGGSTGTSADGREPGDLR
jgi:phage shock protein C